MIHEVWVDVEIFVALLWILFFELGELLMELVVGFGGKEAQCARRSLACTGAAKAEEVLGGANHKLLLGSEFELDLRDALNQA